MPHRFPTLALAAALSVLSPHVHAGDAEPAKAPLTAAEREQCQAQLNEANQGVRAYNAKVDEIKALQVEVEALRVELDKDEAAVDRTNSAAMQALNAKFLRNNEMVERHEQMAKALAAVALENKQRITQFRETCENRPAASPQLPQPAQAAPSEATCDSAIGAKEVQRRIEATFAEMRIDEKKHQDEIDRVAKARAAAQSWTPEKRSKVWLQLIASPKFMAFEQQKQPYVQEMLRIMGSNPKSGQERCQLVQRVAATMPAIKAINARQYAFMAEQIRVAK